MRKELTVYISTNEEQEEVKVQRVADDPQFFLFTLGQNRMVMNIAELAEAVNAIQHYSALFEQEAAIKASRAAAPAKAMDIAPVQKGVPKSKAKSKEDEDAVVFEAEVRSGPTASELALEMQTRHMKGDSLVVTEKNK